MAIAQRDRPLDALCTWLEEYDPAVVDPETRSVAAELVADALGCAAASRDEPVVTKLKQVVFLTGGEGVVTVFTSGRRAALADAVLVNGTMTRAQDRNDAYVRGEAVGHPSDNVAPLLAVAELGGISGRRFLDAAILAIDLYCRLIDETRVDSLYDHSALSAMALPPAIAWMLELGPAQTAAAVSLAVSFARPSIEVRRGELSPAKAIANAMVAASVCTLTYLAAAGADGPSGALVGPGGWMGTVGQGMDLVGLLADPANGRRVEQVSVKAFPCIGTAQGAVAAALRARAAWHQAGEAGVKLKLELPYSSLKATQVDDPTRWRPTTRETADHSIPYLVAVALVEGRVDTDQYERRLWEDARVRTAMDQLSISLEHDSALSQTGARLTVIAPRAEPQVFEVAVAPGDPRAPIRGPALWRRARECLGRTFESDVADAIVQRLRDLDGESSVRELARLMGTRARPFRREGPQLAQAR